MTSFEDKEAVIEATLDAVSAPMESEPHESTHDQRVRKFPVRETGDSSIALSFERPLDGP